MINTIIWLEENNKPEFWDGGGYFLRSLKSYERIYSFSLKDKLDILKQGFPGPPFVYSLTAFFYPITGFSLDKATIISTFIFLAILLYSVYKIGELLLNKKTGLLAAFIVSMYPIISRFSNKYWMDMPATALFVLAIYIALSMKDFTNTKYSIYLAIVFGLGMLTRVSFLVGIPVLLLFLVYPILFNTIRLKKLNKSMKNIIIFSLIFLAICSTWYVPNFSSLMKSHYVKGSIDPASIGWAEPPKLFSIENLSYYFIILINNQISFFYFIVFLISLFFFFKSNIKYKYLLFSIILFFYVFYTINMNKFDRTTMPILPIIALITSIGINKINKKTIKAILIAFIIFIGLFQYMHINFGLWNINPNKLRINLPFKAQTPYGKDFLLFFPWKFSSDKRDWKIDEILNILNNSNKDEINIIFTRHFYYRNPILYESKIRNIKIKEIWIPNNNKKAIKNFLKSDYFITHKNIKIGLYQRNITWINLTNAAFSKIEGNFTKEAEFVLPNNDIITIYKNKKLR